MGHKSVCLNCKKAFNKKFDNESDREYKCPECGKQMILLSHRFRPPKKTEDSKWETVKYLIENGFYYQHIRETNHSNEYLNREEKYVEYPKTLREAKVFVERFKNQARK